MTYISDCYCAFCHHRIELTAEKEIIGVNHYHAHCADTIRQEQHRRLDKGEKSTDAITQPSSSPTGDIYR